MKYGRYGWSHLVISWGLGIVFLWIGLDILKHPTSWLGFVPPHLPLGLTRETALQLNGMLDVGLGILLILRWWQKLAAALAVLHIVGILALNGIDAVLIRDVGLLGAAFGLLLWPTKYRRHRWWKVWQRGTAYSEEEQ